MGRRRPRRLPRPPARMVRRPRHLPSRLDPAGGHRSPRAWSLAPNVTNLSLDPLSDEVMGELLDGLVTRPSRFGTRAHRRARRGHPPLRHRDRTGASGQGRPRKGDDGIAAPVGELGELEIPPGLTALIASRLDALSPTNAVLVKECSVLGGSFPRQAVEALSEIDPALLDELLSSLVRKEVLTVRADKLSPERGQYAFTQSLIRSVAYDMLDPGRAKGPAPEDGRAPANGLSRRGCRGCRGHRRPPPRRLPGRRRRPGRRRTARRGT